MALLEISGVEHSFPKAPSLAFPDWSARSGERWLVLGASGSGKTTLLNILSGLLSPSKGNVRVGGQELSSLKPAECDAFRGKNIGMVFQQLHLVNALTVMGNLMLAQSMAGVKSDPGAAKAILANVRLAGNDRRYPHQLSYGQMQRVALARALINRPKMILADEPTSNLDNSNAERVMDLILEHSLKQGSLLVVSTHDERIRDRFEKTLCLPSTEAMR